MDHPDPVLTLTADPTGLAPAQKRKLRTDTSTVVHCLELWLLFIAAETDRHVNITVVTEAGTAAGDLRFVVPLGLVDEPVGQLATAILNVVVAALVDHAHPQPPSFWAHAEVPQPPADPPEAGIQLRDLLDGDVLLIARHDGTPADADARERILDGYICERMKSPCIAARDRAPTTGTTVCWTLELLPEE